MAKGSSSRFSAAASPFAWATARVDDGDEKLKKKARAKNVLSNNIRPSPVFLRIFPSVSVCCKGTKLANSSCASSNDRVESGSTLIC